MSDTTLLLIEDGAIIVAFLFTAIAVTVAWSMFRAWVLRRRARASFYSLRRLLEDGRRDGRAFEDVCWARLRSADYEAAIGFTVGRRTRELLELISDILNNRRGGFRVVTPELETAGVD